MLGSPKEVEKISENPDATLFSAFTSMSLQRRRSKMLNHHHDDDSCAKKSNIHRFVKK